MTITYAAGSGSDRDRVRFAIGDTADGSGPLPGGANFADAELDDLLTVEGTWQRATAAAFEVLASRWRKYTDLQVGPRRESLHLIAQGYADDAKRWRDQYGKPAASGNTARAGWITRQDGYSDDIDAGEA